jgi:anti-anti-sigma factor
MRGRKDRRPTVINLPDPADREEDTDALKVVHFSGRKVALDGLTVSRIHDQIAALAEQPDYRQLFLDFSNVDFVCAATLTLLVRLHLRLRAAGRRLTIGELNPWIHEVFVVTGLDRLLDLRCARAATAVAHLGARAVAGADRRHNWINLPLQGV